LHCENPRQVSAYHYPRQYGPVSPSFSRALLQTTDQHQLLYLSGTASIIGHESIHLNDPVQQTMEVVQNIRTVIEHANNTYKAAVSHLKARMLKVYIRDREHYLTIKNTVEQQFGKHTSILYLQGDICRQDLLVEIEGLFE
jgi:chorismate lyase/3-hydroxybenzoate synthase